MATKQRIRFGSRCGQKCRIIPVFGSGSGFVYHSLIKIKRWCPQNGGHSLEGYNLRLFDAPRDFSPSCQQASPSWMCVSLRSKQAHRGKTWIKNKYAINFLSESTSDSRKKAMNGNSRQRDADGLWEVSDVTTLPAPGCEIKPAPLEQTEPIHAASVRANHFFSLWFLLPARSNAQVPLPF